MSINICALTVPFQLCFKKAVESLKCLCSFLKGHKGCSSGRFMKTRKYYFNAIVHRTFRNVTMMRYSMYMY